MTRTYTIYKNDRIRDLEYGWESPAWGRTGIARIDHFHPQSTAHRPVSEVKICYNDAAIHMLYRVRDRDIRCRHTAYNAKVHEDSCVEWFIRPPDAEGYYNIEINCGGTLHVNYIVDPERDAEGKRKDLRRIPREVAEQIGIRADTGAGPGAEVRGPVTWKLAVRIPFGFFTYYTPLKTVDDTKWQGNLYKCGDKTSHPHWASWNPVRELNFHQPACFGEFHFRK